MKARALAFLLVVPCSGPTWANLYTVTNNQNAGDGSLRWAIKQANSHPGQDKILFNPSLAGKAILLKTQLPTLTDSRTTINGDINRDGRPDIAINGTTAPGASGLVVEANNCVIAGLAIRECQEHGMVIENARGCEVRSCHIGLNLAGTQVKNNWDHQLVLRGAQECRIGGSTKASRNVISGGYRVEPYTETYGILVEDSANNTIAGNYIGVNRDGTAVLGNGDCGVYLVTLPQATAAGGADGVQSIECTGNTIGGSTPVERNVIAGVLYGMQLTRARENTVLGNTFGLAADGNTALPMGFVGVRIRAESARNTIGGTVPGARNVFAEAETGVTISGPGADNNRIRGNYFGTNVAGDRQRKLRVGVVIGGSAGRQSIGGGTTGAGNYFAPKWPSEMHAVWFDQGGAGTAVRHNKFGVRPNGALSPTYHYAIRVSGVPVEVTDNEIVNAGMGITCENTPRPMRAFRNRLRRCYKSLYVHSTARCLFGNLGNSSTDDDGGNVIRSTSWYIINQSPWRVLAEGTDFGTTSRSQINQKIFDRKDSATVGRVDFDPLIGGVSPTGTTAVLAVTGATGVPTGAGAQITFTLSSDAQVGASVLNIAGRPVRALCRLSDCQAGANTLLWNGYSDGGVSVPNGVYLVEIAASTPDGASARALIQVRMER